MAQGHEYFTARLEAIGDERLDGPGALPGWSGRHLLSHVGHNATAPRRSSPAGDGRRAGCATSSRRNRNAWTPRSTRSPTRGGGPRWSRPRAGPCPRPRSPGCAVARCGSTRPSPTICSTR
ncbi:maleylpyruvate isomerase N-terminal domain-containing protein [Streptomyces sp. NPDC005970]|uniref:maleylpyruvate isomerase N-terminal domain-containing protein n=1 Tax=Streptomyces sp. NPDC005970 TaxID=3156723 RepID=UPI0033C5EB98